MKRSRPAARALAISVLVSFLTVDTSTAGINRWTSLGPYQEGGDVVALAVDPRSPSIVYAGTFSNGVFRSVDGGETWAPVNEGLSDWFVSFIAIDRNSAVYVGTSSGLFKSENAGALWEPLRGGLPPGAIQDLAIEPGSPPNLYAAAGAFGLYKSGDAGRNWTRFAEGLEGHSVSGIAIDANAPGILYASTRTSLFRTSDGGSNWRPLSAAPSVIQVLEVDPASSAVYVGTFDGLFKSSDLGDTFARVQGGLPQTSIRKLVIGPGPSPILYAATRVEGIFRSDDAGATWTEADNGIPEVFALAALSLSPSSPSTLYAGLNFFPSANGVFKSTDRGATWFRSSGFFQTQPVGRIATHPDVPGRILAGTIAGVLVTADGGSTWSAKNLGLSNLQIFELKTAPSSASVVYVATGSGLFRSLDAAESWTAVNPTDRSSCGALAVDPATASTVYAGCFEGGSPPYSYSIRKSTDSGSSWTVAHSSPTLATLELGIPSGSPATVYAGLSEGGILRSTDAGATWTFLPVPGARSIVSLAFDPRSPLTIYATAAYTGVRVPGAVPGTILKSLDGGATWTRILETYDPSAVAVNPFSPDEVYASAAHEGPVLRSRDRGVTWRPAGAGLFGIPSTFAFAPANPSIVYAGTYFGVFAASFTPAAEGNCPGDPATLCLQNARFYVRVSWRAPTGSSGAGQAVPLTADTGAFWFFQSSNLELVVKVLDGRAVNGRFWVFYGSLTNVEFTLTVTDLVTGAVKIYTNAQGQLASVADTAAF